MKKTLLALSMVATIFITAGCSSTAEDADQARKATRMTVVSSAKPADVLPAFKTFTWNEDYNHVLSAVSHESRADIKQYLRAEIIQYLNTKGYVYQPDPIQADVVIGFLFALEDDLADQKIQDKFGLLPGVSNSGITDKRYAKGTFLVAVLDNKATMTYWRSAMQGFVNLEQDRKDESTDHIQAVLDMMMGGFPQAGR
ncbi:DUF4136 domain-containing protein [Psychromonas sp. psych-6C06]|uniref:DUF4136 domain-containing protein n=1 Tax=Psychromonas sp. psych-6C06 TaxID=2058089 RepID=UPI000C34E799|nr:DUF4136 domain-containing protein [Psychromonas sp. psych-6C06]PKF60288.1 DUF4136 domain-containing protein [Psychromonas sp. psych-6C06]